MSYEHIANFVTRYGGVLEGDSTDFYGSFYYKDHYVWIQSNKEGNWFDAYIGSFNIARYVKRVSSYDEYARNRCFEEHDIVVDQTVPMHFDWYLEETLIACADMDEYFSDICITSTTYRFDEANFEKALELSLQYSEACMAHMNYTPNHSYTTV